MKHFVTDLITRLSSRKFLASIGGFVVLVQQHRYPEAAGVIGAFIASEAGVDIAAARKGADTAVADVQKAAASFESNLKD